MKKLRVLLAIVLMFALAIVSCSTSSEGDVSLTILQTSDIHDHAGGYGSAASYNPVVTGDDTVLGGYARMASYINHVRNEKGASTVLLCDSGDFTMGTVYTMTLASSPLSFMFFSLMNYDAVTFGNHETDLGPDALAGFIMLARNNTSAPFTTPIVASNMDASASPAMNALFGNGAIAKSTMVVKSGIKVGILGRMGSNAVFDAANAAPLTFDSGQPDSAAAYAALQTQVNALRAAGAKVIVLLSHEGFTVDPATGYAIGNDAELAKNVSGIDVILSGHLHINQTAVKASADSDTILVEPGAYGEHIARLDLKVDKHTGKVKSYTSANSLIDSSIPGDLTMVYVVSGLVNPALDAALVPAFSGLGLAGVDSILDTVAINDAPITSDSITPGFTVGESVLGNLASDSYRNAINGIWASAYAQYGGAGANVVMAQSTGDPNRVQIAFVPGGVIRDPLTVSPVPNISFADLYNVLPLGGDPVDNSALGYPLLTTYIKGADIYTAVGISLQLGMAMMGGTPKDDFVINYAGIYVQILPTTSLSGLGYDVYLCPTDANPLSPNYGMNDNIPSGAGTFINPGDGTTIYKIAVDLYTLMMMYQVHALYPMYEINTYDASGSLEDASDNRVWTGATTTMRGWQAIIGWSWAASGQATSNLSNAGYTSALPYRRLQ